jgi:hypothetical protein
MVERWRRARYEIARRSFGWRTIDLRKNRDLEQAWLWRFHERGFEHAPGRSVMVNADVDGFLKRPYEQTSRVPAWSDSQTEEALRQAGSASRLSPHSTCFYFSGPVLGVLELDQARRRRRARSGSSRLV